MLRWTAATRTVACVQSVITPKNQRSPTALVTWEKSLTRRKPITSLTTHHMKKITNKKVVRAWAILYGNLIDRESDTGQKEIYGSKRDAIYASAGYPDLVVPVTITYEVPSKPIKK